MKSKLLIISSVVFVVTATCAGAYWLANRTDAVAALRAQGRNGASEQQMLSTVDNLSRPKEVSADDIINLKNDGVPENVIVTLLRKKE
jgi:hypothetical protein